MVDINKIIPKVRTWADGTVIPDHVFENEPDEAFVLRWAGMSDEKRRTCAAGCGESSTTTMTRRWSDSRIPNNDGREVGEARRWPQLKGVPAWGAF